MTLEPQIPEGFDAFWRETTEEALSQPLDFGRHQGNSFDLPGFIVQTLTFRSIAGLTLHGWIAIPQIDNRESKIGDYSFLWIPPYGRESMLPNAYGTRDGFVSMSFNFFGHDAFHQEKYVTARGYFSEGLADPHTWVFRRMFQDAVVAARVLAEQPEVDRSRLTAMGMSQGGGMSIWLGAWLPLIRVICADMPFMGGFSQTLHERVYRYPTKELVDFAASAPGGLDTVKRTLSYFDTLNMATRCQVPTQVSLGEKDPASRPNSVEAIYSALPGPKRLLRYPIGHDWYPEMIDNNPDWILRNFSS